MDSSNLDKVKFDCEKQCTKKFISSCLSKIEEEQTLLDGAVHKTYMEYQVLKSRMAIMEALFKDGKTYQDYVKVIKEIDNENNKSIIPN